MPITYFGDEFLGTDLKYHRCNVPDVLGIRPGYVTIYKLRKKKDNIFAQFLEEKDHKKFKSWTKNKDGTRQYYACQCCHRLYTAEELKTNKKYCSSCENLQKNKPNQNLSHKAKLRFFTAIDWMHLLAEEKKAYNTYKGCWFPFKLNMITLSLPSKQLHTDLECKTKLLNSFLQILRQQYSLKNYAWRAEKQFNFNIHFHIITDIYIHHSEVCRLWNQILDNHGYIENYRKNQQAKHKNGFQYDRNLYKKLQQKDQTKYIPIPYDQQLRAYKKGVSENWNNPTSDNDTHAISDVDNSRIYMGKYVTKKIQESECLKHHIREYKIQHKTDKVPVFEIEKIKSEIESKMSIDGNIWYLSQNLSKLKTVRDINPETKEESPALMPEEDWDWLKNFITKRPEKFKEYDHCSIIEIDIPDLMAHGPPGIKKLISDFVEYKQKSAFQSKRKMNSILGIPLDLWCD